MKKVATFILLGVLGWVGPVMGQARPDLMYCGSTGASGAELYTGAGPFNEIFNSCAPDINTQAMLVTRSGSISGNGSAWLAYLNAGGIIVNEYSNSHNVYNEIYGTAYARGSGEGNCIDNSMPAVKINPSHPFWLSNPLTETPSGQEACGFDIASIVAGEAEVTALGGWLSGATSFAYRPQGSGVLVLLDADWQDGQAQYSSDSEAFMGAILGGGVTGAAPAPPPESATPIPTMSVYGLTLTVLGVVLVVARRLRLSVKRR